MFHDQIGHFFVKWWNNNRLFLLLFLSCRQQRWMWNTILQYRWLILRHKINFLNGILRFLHSFFPRKWIVFIFIFFFLFDNLRLFLFFFFFIIIFYLLDLGFRFLGSVLLVILIFFWLDWWLVLILFSFVADCFIHFFHYDLRYWVFMQMVVVSGDGFN